MKVKVLRAFFDDNGIHKKGEIVDVKVFQADRMELVEEKEKKATKKK